MTNQIFLAAAVLASLAWIGIDTADSTNAIVNSPDRTGTHQTAEAIQYIQNGRGKLALPNGRSYVGDIRDGIPNGQGSMTYPDGQRYVGPFVDGQRNGRGMVTFPDGRTFVGEYRNDKRNGPGVLTLPGGEKYVGEYRDGEKNGQGTSYLANGQIEASGSWVNGNFAGGSAAATALSPGAAPRAPSYAGRTGPSFDCVLARDALAILVCGNDKLAWLDLRFVQAYQALRLQAGDTGQPAVRQEAVDFQRYVYTNCGLPRSGTVPPSGVPTAEACVAAAYQQQRNLWAGRLSAVLQDEADRPLPRHIQLQADLQKLNFIPPTDRVDGVYGPSTRAAITAWQTTHDLPATGTLSSSDAQLLDEAANGAAPSFPAAASTQVPPTAAVTRSNAEIEGDADRRLAISRAEAEKAKAEAAKAQAEAERARAEADVFAAKERASEQEREKAAEQARAQQDARGIQP